MKPFLLSLSFLLSCLVSQGQYYVGLDTSLTASAFKTELHVLISSNTSSIPYGPSGTYTVVDFMCDYDYTGGEVLDRYAVTDYTDCYGDRYSSGTSPSATGQGWNREHVFPRSWWGGNTGTAMNSDVHNLFPSDAYVNQLKSNYMLGEVTSGATSTTVIGQEINACASGCSDQVFEPADQFKGDLARAMLYMAVRYEDQVIGWENSNCRGDAVLTGESYFVYEECALATLLYWHQNDLPDAMEIGRNDGAEAVQGNRNPFIDHPEWTMKVWGTSDGTLISPAVEGEVVATCPIDTWEVVTLAENSSFNNGGQWTVDGSGFSINAYCGSSCTEYAESWLISAPFDASESGGLKFLFSAQEQFGDTPLEIYYTTAYAGCPTSIGNNWQQIGVLTDDMLATQNTFYPFLFDLDALAGETAVTIAFKYADDGADGFNFWGLDQLRFRSDVCPIQGAAVTSSCVACPTDLNSDGITDVADFILFNSAFGQNCLGCPSDFDADDIIGVSDFLLLNSAFGVACGQ